VEPSVIPVPVLVPAIPEEPRMPLASFNISEPFPVSPVPDVPVIPVPEWVPVVPDPPVIPDCVLVPVMPVPDCVPPVMLVPDCVPVVPDPPVMPEPEPSKLLTSPPLPDPWGMTFGFMWG